VEPQFPLHAPGLFVVLHRRLPNTCDLAACARCVLLPDVDINFGGTAASWTSSGSKTTKKDSGKSGSGSSNSTDNVVDTGPAPIIIVPTDARGALTMFNIKELLENGRFKTTAEAKAAGARRERRLTLNRPIRGGVVKQYEVVDSARALSKSDWSRVIAVFVSSGKLYQFNGWPKDVATPVQIFSKFAGFNVRFSDEVPDPAIKSWKVTTFDISKNPDKR
jgi:parafibromin